MQQPETVQSVKLILASRESLGSQPTLHPPSETLRELPGPAHPPLVSTLTTSSLSGHGVRTRAGLFLLQGLRNCGSLCCKCSSLNFTRLLQSQLTRPPSEKPFLTTCVRKPLPSLLLSIHLSSLLSTYQHPELSYLSVRCLSLIRMTVTSLSWVWSICSPRCL